MDQTENPVTKKPSRRIKRKATPEERTRNTVEFDLPKSGEEVSAVFPWAREDFLADLRKATWRITDELEAEPEEAERLDKSIKQAREGELIWGDLKEEDEKDDSA